MDKSKKKRFIEGISNFGISKIDETLVKWGSERVRAYSGDLTREDVAALASIAPIEGIGLYLGKDSIDKRTGVHEYRLSMDSVNLLKDKVTENIIDIDEEQEKEWFFGRNIQLDKEQYKELNGFVAVRSRKDRDFVGVGKVGQDGILYNFIPKERRVKVSVIK
jgi:NOL1/NOP2/fmu family ribosome biogenesis protein